MMTSLQPPPPYIYTRDLEEYVYNALTQNQCCCVAMALEEAINIGYICHVIAPDTQFDDLISLLLYCSLNI